VTDDDFDKEEAEEYAAGKYFDEDPMPENQSRERISIPIYEWSNHYIMYISGKYTFVTTQIHHLSIYSSECSLNTCKGVDALNMTAVDDFHTAHAF